MSHEKRGASDEWYTPKYIFDAMGISFFTDVASPVDTTFCHVPAIDFIFENSLEQDWCGTVWMNPPYGHNQTKTLWLDKFIKHGDGVALMPDRTSAPWWQKAAPCMDAIMFLSHKVKFIKPDGTLGGTAGQWYNTIRDWIRRSKRFGERPTQRARIAV